jgi:hypothetical protein
MTTARRKLVFEDWSDVTGDVEKLHRDGYRKAGRWDLAQACNHLADWMEFPLDGFPTPPLAMRPVLWAVKTFAGRSMLRKTLETRSMPAGVPTLPATAHSQGGDEARAVDRLKATIARFQAHTGPFHPSPVFGEADREIWNRVQRIHCAHHLSFLIPTAE